MALKSVSVEHLFFNLNQLQILLYSIEDLFETFEVYCSEVCSLAIVFFQVIWFTHQIRLTRWACTPKSCGVVLLGRLPVTTLSKLLTHRWYRRMW